MKVRDVVIGCLAAAVAAPVFAEIRAVTPAAPDSDWAKRWWPKKFDAKAKELKEKGGSAVIFLGDSITDLWEDSWRGKSVWDATFAAEPYRAIDLGFSGDRTEHVLYRIAHGEFDGYRAKAIVLMIGTNNAWHRPFSEEPPIDTVVGVKRILEALRAKQPDARVILHPIFPCSDKQQRLRNETVNRELVKFADGRHVVWCDISDQFTLPDGTVSKEVLYDGTHPGAFGYVLWANALKPTLDACLAAKPGEWVASRFAQHLSPWQYAAGEVPALTPSTRISLGKDFSDGWWLEKIARNRRIISESKGEIDLVFMGDSITHYWDVGEGEDTSTEIEDLRKTYTILNAGYGGDQVQHLLWRAKNGELDGYKTKLVMLMIGTNNCHGQKPEDIAAGTREVIRVIREKQPQAKILLLPIFPRGAKYDDRAYALGRAVNEILAKDDFGPEVIRFSFADKLVDANGVTRPELFDQERLHLTDAGYVIWRKAVEPFFKKYCAPQAETNGWRTIRGFHTSTADAPQKPLGKDETVFAYGIRDGRFDFRFDVKDADVCVATTVKHPLDIANGDRVEVYFVPDAKMEKGYRCAEIDASGRVLSYSVSAKKDYDWFWKFQTLKCEAKRTADGYTVSGSVSVDELKSFGINPASFHLGVFRADMSAPGKVAKWCSAAPLLLPANFHQPAMLFPCNQ